MLKIFVDTSDTEYLTVILGVSLKKTLTCRKKSVKDFDKKDGVVQT